MVVVSDLIDASAVVQAEKMFCLVTGWSEYVDMVTENIVQFGVFGKSGDVKMAGDDI